MWNDVCIHQSRYRSEDVSRYSSEIDEVRNVLNVCDQKSCLCRDEGWRD